MFANRDQFRAGVVLGALLCCTSLCGTARGQATVPSTTQASEQVTLNLPENAPLKVLIDYVSQEFGWNILYDEQVATQRITIKGPAKLPKEAVPVLLGSLLRMKGLELVDGDLPGWKRIVPLAQAAKLAPKSGGGPDAAATQVFKLRYLDPTKLDTLVKPFLTQPGGSSLPLAGQGLLVVTDYASNLRRVSDLVRSVDQPNRDAAIEFFPVKHADPARLTQQVEQLLRAKLRAQGGDEHAPEFETAYDARTNQLAVVAPKEQLADVRAVIAALDTVVAEEQSPVRFYKLANATASEVLATIRGLEGEAQEESAGAPMARPASRAPGRLQAGTSSRAPANATGRLRDSTTVAPSEPAPTRETTPGAAMQRNAYAGAPQATTQQPTAAAATETAPQLRDVLRTRQARVTADPNTNSIIVVAPPDVQRMYEQLIRSLDKRRPQVLIECTIVTLDTTENAQFGVEIGRAGGSGRNQIVTFSSFGLSTPNPETGRLALLPGAGFNGALISSDIADVVVRALAQSTRARVTSAPRILVNDNNAGTLSSIAEFPYASVNASNTVATTSFGDYAQAGTEITVTPHISEADYLQLEYSVSLSSFTGGPVQQGDTILPPPRKADSVQSQVTIPDGSTIVVGGLNRKNFTQTVDKLPFLGDIPLLGYLFSNRSHSNENSTLFVFIRPVILRDDKFADLRFLSEQDVRAAEVPGDFPASEPLTVR